MEAITNLVSAIVTYGQAIYVLTDVVNRLTVDLEVVNEKLVKVLATNAELTRKVANIIPYTTHTVTVYIHYCWTHGIISSHTNCDCTRLATRQKKKELQM